MLPDAYDMPAGRSEASIGKPIPVNVALQLRSPVPLVVCRLPSMIRADMPEAAIHEDCDLRSREHQVGADAACGEIQAVVLTESTSAPVEKRAEGHLGLGVGAPDGREVAGPALAAGPRLARTAWAACVTGGHVPKLTRRCWACPPSCGRMARMAPACIQPHHAHGEEWS